MDVAIPSQVENLSPHSSFAYEKGSITFPNAENIVNSTSKTSVTR